MHVPCPHVDELELELGSTDPRVFVAATRQFFFWPVQCWLPV